MVVLRKCNATISLGDAIHERENPLRWDKSLGPRIMPARRMKDLLALALLPFFTPRLLICRLEVVVCLIGYQSWGFNPHSAIDNPQFPSPPE
jgi:hypothetical protein